MNNIITLKKLAEEIASMTGTDIATAEIFLTEFFATLEDSLSAGESIKIKGIGIFSRCDNTAQPVKFTPEKDFIEAVNTPFEMFSAVDIDDSISDEDLTDDEEVDDNDPAPTETDDIVDTEDNDEKDVDEDTIETSSVETTDDEADTVIENNEDTEFEVVETETENDEAETEEESHRHGKMSFVSSLVLGLLVGFACGWIVSSYTGKKDRSNTDILDKATEAINRDSILADSIVSLTEGSDSVKTDTIETIGEIEAAKENITVDRQPKQIITDTIRSNCFLTTMARRYYGKMDYWAFIYEANAEKLGHPNRIKPGTVVVIPPLDEICNGENEAEALQRAKKLGKEIYERYD